MHVRPLRRTLLGALAALMAVGAVAARPASADGGPVVSMGDVSGLERDDALGSVMVPVYLSSPAAEPVVVSYYTVNDTAVYLPLEERTDPELFGDYQRRGTPEVPRTVTIPAGTLQTTINVVVNVDDEVESDESFDVVISSVSGANAAVGRASGSATIVDSDGLAGPNPVLSVSSGSVVEGDGGQRRAQFYVHLSRAATSALTLSYTTADGTATAPDRYTAKLPGSATLAPGQISKTIDVLVGSDDVVGTDASFTLQVSVSGGAPVEELSTTGTATILEDDAAPPVTITPMLAAGNNHTCVLTSAGAIRCWGDNTQGQLGDGTTTDSLSPVTVSGLGGPATNVVTGDSQTCALTTAGGVKCWGNNLNGQLGDGTTTQSSVPVDVTGLASGVTALAAGDNHTCAALSTGTVKCWGWGTQGQLGAGTLSSSSTPVDVQGLPAGATVAALSAGYQHTCAVLSDGSARCWGRNNSGQLGIGTTAARSTSAVQPLGLTTGVTAVVNGGNHTCMVQSGLVKCFGLNSAGQLGNGLTTNSTSPVAVTGLVSIESLAAGGAHSCARSTSGAVTCWGLNQEGELGIGLTNVNNSPLPLAVTGLGAQDDLSAGIQHVCALQSDETVRCWGLNSAGQLGNGNTTRQFSPVLVLSLSLGL